VGGCPHPLGSEWNWDLMRTVAVREARRYFAAAHDVDDVVQEALVRAWRRRTSCHGADRMPWMRQIARNEALRLLARRQRRAELEFLDDQTLLGGIADAEALEAQEDLLLRMHVEQALARLSIDDRQLLALRYDRDLTQLEVARMLGIPEGTVKIRLHRLRGRLRKALDATHEAL
jgi:RNA polymerase sigma-70 factor (ECF subfamily)